MRIKDSLLNFWKATKLQQTPEQNQKVQWLKYDCSKQNEDMSQSKSMDNEKKKRQRDKKQSMWLV